MYVGGNNALNSLETKLILYPYLKPEFTFRLTVCLPFAKVWSSRSLFIVIDFNFR